MKHPLPSLDGLKAFESAARHLSFSLAADELCLSKGAISYQIRKLEQQLQCALFKRSVRQVYLTDSGQVLLQTTQQIFAELGDTLQRLQGEKRQTGVSVAATTYVSVRWLSRYISTFNEAYPGVSVLLQHSVNSADFKLADVDLAIRWGPCSGRTDHNRFGEMPMPLYPVVSPALLKKHNINCALPVAGARICDADFARLPLLGEDRTQDLWQEWFNRTNLYHSEHQLQNPRQVITDANVRVQAAIDGQGMVLADKLMINELDNKLLVAPFRETLDGYGYALLCSASRILSDNAEDLKNWLSNRADI